MRNLARRGRMLVLFTGLLMLLGCGDVGAKGWGGAPVGATPSGWSSTQRVEQPAVAVGALLDITGSGLEEDVRRCTEGVRGAVLGALPGDRVQVRLIGAHSFSAEMLVTDLRLPKPTRRGAYDLTHLGSDTVFAARLDSLRNDAVVALATIEKRSPEPRSAIWAAIAATVESLRLGEQDGRAIWICSDGKDTENDPVPVDLSGFHVFFALSHGKNDKMSEVYARRAAWERALKERGATSVEFRPPGDVVEIDALRARVLAKSGDNPQRSGSGGGQ